METRYPIRKADGKDFAGPDEVLALLRNEKHGQWLAGNNGMWHGGIHISRNAAPQAVISAESPEGAIPIQCIAQGEIVAWRIQQEYHQQPYGEAVEGEEPVMLQNSSAFVLVRSVHKPDDNPATWLTFYTLYMHLAPLSCFPKMKMFQVTQQGNGLSMRRYSGSEEPGQLAPDSSGRLRAGDKVVVTEEITFMLRSKKRDLAGRTPPDVPSPFGLAQKVKDGVPQGEKFWTSALPQYVAPLGDKYAYLPDWMAKAVESGSLDAVVIPPEPVAIRAGEAIGFLARDDAPGRGSAVLSDWFMHIEVLSNDANMPAFLSNPGHLTKGTMYLEVQGNQPLYYCEEKGDKKTFTVMDVTTSTDAGKLLRRDDASPFKDDAGITWYKLRPHTWMKQDAVKEIIQHDLKALRFTPLQQEPAKDFQQSLGEQWLGKAFSFIGGAIHPERALESQELSEYYSQIAKVLDANGDGKISSTELDLYRSAVLQGLRNRNEEVEMLLRRLIVKHESEWYGKSAHPRWQTLLASLPKDGQDYVKKWIDNHEWMSQVPALAKDEALWHFHPVEFIEKITSMEKYIITVELVEKLLGHKNPWFTGKRGGKPFAEKFKDSYPNAYEYDKNDFVNTLNSTMSEFGISGPYHKAHFLSQCLHESAHFDTTLEFGTGEGYNPGAHVDAYKNENRVMGDGPKYRGRGLIQLTWKRNYRLYSEFSGEDVVSNPDKVAENMQLAISTACWFWRFNGGVAKKHNAQGDINILIDNEPQNVELISKAVNGGANGLGERIACFNEIKREWSLK